MPEMKMTHYFAYGSDLSLRQLRQRLVEVEIVLEDIPRHAAQLPDYELRFSQGVPSHPAIGFAAIHPCPGQIVEGVLYELPEQALSHFDTLQGVPEGRYLRREVSVNCPDFGTVPAQAYFPGPEWIREGLKPSRNHLYKLLAAESLLSPEYFSRLKKIESIKVPVDDQGLPYGPGTPKPQK
ncbi:MAG TPA: gamma-glutamylcyclotransferase family protein [Fibrobacteraceae bacterium]|nr:gamma-glutamylcyclotransferase family protein [Fibrobacteraceae bacterium]